jgi:hypothetical protein
MEYFPKYKTAIAMQINTDDPGKLKSRPRGFVAEAAKIIFAGR